MRAFSASARERSASSWATSARRAARRRFFAAWGSGGARLREGGGDALRRLEGGSEVVGVGFGFVGRAGGGGAEVDAEAVAVTVAGGGWVGGGSRGLRGEDLRVVLLGRLGRLLGVLWIPVGSVVTTGSGMPSWVGVGGSSGSGSSSA